MKLQEYMNRHALKCMILGFCLAFLIVCFGAAGYAYADSPAFCGSCHSMTEAHASWRGSNHKEVACTECHLPHRSFVGKLVAKAETGLSDTYHEVLRDYPAHIQLSEEGQGYVNDNCLRCHSSTMEKVHTSAEGNQDCLKCHKSVAHGSTVIEGGIKIE